MPISDLTWNTVLVFACPVRTHISRSSLGPPYYKTVVTASVV
jgi:hypothetical protein